MNIQINSTSKLVWLNGVPARIWEGKTDSGIDVICFITRIAVSKNADESQFKKELEEHQAPSVEAESFPLRMIL